MVKQRWKGERDKKKSSWSRETSKQEKMNAAGMKRIRKSMILAPTLEPGDKTVWDGWQMHHPHLSSLPFVALHFFSKQVIGTVSQTNFSIWLYWLFCFCFPFLEEAFNAVGFPWGLMVTCLASNLLTSHPWPYSEGSSLTHSTPEGSAEPFGILTNTILETIQRLLTKNSKTSCCSPKSRALCLRKLNSQAWYNHISLNQIAKWMSGIGCPNWCSG